MSKQNHFVVQADVFSQVHRDHLSHNSDKHVRPQIRSGGAFRSIMVAIYQFPKRFFESLPRKACLSYSKGI